MAIGVFGLKQVYKKQLENVEERNLSYWPEGAIYGYFSGGYNGTTVNTITRLDHSNETVSSPGKNLLTQKYIHFGLYSSLYGYYNGGLINPGSSVRTEVDRIDFSSETVSQPGKNITGRFSGASISSRYYGYMSGGQSVSSTQRLDFFNETIQAGYNMSYGLNYGGGLMDNFNYGYTIGGSATSLVDRIDYSSETYTRRTPLPRDVENSATVASAGYGYSLTGYSPSAPNYLSTIIRLEFSSETPSVLPSVLPQTRPGASGTYNTSNAYIAGGDNGVSFLNTISRLDFSTELTSNPGNNLPAGVTGIRGVNGGASILPS